MIKTFRRFSPIDLANLAQLITTTEAAGEELGCDVDTIQAELEANMAELAQTCWLAQVETGQVVGYNYLEKVTGPEAIHFWLRGLVHPAWRGQGIGRELICRSWTDMGQLREQDSRLAFVNAWAYEHDRTRCRLFARFDLRPYHIYHELAMPASHIPPMPQLPPGVTIQPWADHHCVAAARLRNLAFAQNWGYQPTTAEALRRHFQRGRYEPAYSFTAWHGANPATARMVGLVHGCLAWARKLRQANEGEIVWIAVAEEARGQGIGQALLVKAMTALRAGGAEIISVSADNHTDRPQLGLYTKSGFAVRKAIIDYRGQI